MPGTAMDKSQDGNAMWIASTPPYMFEFAYTEAQVGPDAQAFLDHSAAGNGQVNFTVRPSKIEVQGCPGRDFTQIDADGTKIRTREVLVGKRLYRYSVLNSNGDIADPRVEKYIDSFKLAGSVAKK